MADSDGLVLGRLVEVLDKLWHVVVVGRRGRGSGGRLECILAAEVGLGQRVGQRLEVEHAVTAKLLDDRRQHVRQF